MKTPIAALVLTLCTATFASAQSTMPADVSNSEQQAVIPPGAVPERGRPALLVPMYGALVTLHGLDVHSTVRALRAGHREANPLFENGKPGPIIGAKIASAAATVWLTERLWKKNRVAAVLVMAGVNASMAAVVANNYRIGSQPAR